MKRVRALTALGAIVILGLSAGSVSAAPGHPGHIKVHPGQSIQAAIDAAAPGATIDIARGTYWENLLITKTIHLKAKGATLREPAEPTPNLCSFAGTSGICVIGELDENFNVLHEVRDVTIDGLTVRGFDSMGVFAVGTHGLKAEHDTFAYNGEYGIFANQASNTTYRWNAAHDNNAPGFYVGDSPNANVRIEHNASWNNNGEGLLFRDSIGGRIADNDFHDNCVGMFILDTGAPGAAGWVKVEHNKVWRNNRLCPGEEGENPPVGGIGIGVLGAQHSTIKKNTVNGNIAPDGSQLPGGGIVLLDTTAFGGGVPNDNTFLGNHLKDNVQLDIFGDGTGSGNVFKKNHCSSSNIPGAC